MIEMHEGQWVPSIGTVKRLVAEQFPVWRDLTVAPVASHGTVNSLFRLGREVVLRFPLFPTEDPTRRRDLLAVQEMVSALSGRVSVQLPRALGIGSPGDGYPGHWPVYAWIEGETAALVGFGDPDEFAVALAGFVTQLHSLPTDGRVWNGQTRGGPLADLDGQVRQCIADSASLVDAQRVEAVWEECVRTPGGGPEAWIHADLMPGNLLVRDGRLVAVIDCEGICVGDAAVDLMPAWNLLPQGARRTFRQGLGIDDETWIRGRGWALSQAIIALPYYVDTNQVMADTAIHTLAALLDDCA